MHALSVLATTSLSNAGEKEAQPRSKEQIKPFVDFYHINMKDFEPSDINAYPVSIRVIKASHSMTRML